MNNREVTVGQCLYLFCAAVLSSYLLLLSCEDYLVNLLSSQQSSEDTNIKAVIKVLISILHDFNLELTDYFFILFPIVFNSI